MKNRQQRLRASSYKLVIYYKLQPVKLDALLHDSLEYSILIGQS